MERALIEQAQKGDRGAFDALVRRKVDAVYGTALAILGHEADAQDAVQEAFVAAWRSLGALRDADRFDTKTASSASIHTNEEVTYTLVVTNNGPDTASDAVVSDTLPSGCVFVSASTGRGLESGRPADRRSTTSRPRLRASTAPLAVSTPTSARSSCSTIARTCPSPTSLKLS